ncbi:YoaK family protein [Streptomyces sp. NPDC059949]|uniref:YoaK family protein n=1 Tax=Streptomyces sp. NPDC059949 TaxID=3347013 RepID=UPI00365A8481
MGVSLSGVMKESREAGRGARARRGRPALPTLMLVLTVVTGLVEAVSLLALGPVFTAMQTGNVLFLSFGVARAGDLPALPSAVSLAAFVVGVVCGALMEAAAEARGRRWFVIGLGVEAVLILVAAGIGWGLERHYGAPTERQLAVAAVLALAMGIRTLTIMRSNVPGVPTTLVTRSMTAFLSGSTLGQGSSLEYGSPSWVRRGLAVPAMFLGGMGGALLLVGAGWTVNWLLLPASGLVLAVGLTAYLEHPRLHTGQSSRREPCEPSDASDPSDLSDLSDPSDPSR